MSPCSEFELPMNW